jgi:hypothetical protein
MSLVGGSGHLIVHFIQEEQLIALKCVKNNWLSVQMIHLVTLHGSKETLLTTPGNACLCELCMLECCPLRIRWNMVQFLFPLSYILNLVAP